MLAVHCSNLHCSSGLSLMEKLIVKYQQTNINALPIYQCKLFRHIFVEADHLRRKQVKFSKKIKL